MHHLAMTSPIEAPFRPGFLMEPLGWLTQRLAVGLKSDPELLTAIFELDAYRMHGLGLSLAHCDPEGLSPSAAKGSRHAAWRRNGRSREGTSPRSPPCSD